MGRQRGQGLVEYALLIALIAVAAAASLRAVGPAAREAFQRAVLTIGDGDITFETPAPTLTAEATLTPEMTTTPPASVTPGTTATPQPTATPVATATPVFTPTPVPTPGDTEVKDGCSAVLKFTHPGLSKAACNLNHSFEKLSAGTISISPALPNGTSLIVNLPAGSYTFHGALTNGQPAFSGPLSLSQGDLDALAGGFIIFTASYLPVDGGFKHVPWQGTVNIQVIGIVAGVDIIPAPGPIVPKPPVVLD